MDRTPISLLEQVRNPADQEAWKRFVQLYTPLLFACACRLVAQEPDAADLVQDVFLVLVRKLPEFTYDRHKSFRGWLRTLTLNKWRDNCKKRRLPLEGAGDAPLAQVPGPNDRDGFGEAEYRRQLVGRALHLMQAEFQATTWQACWQFVVQGRSAADVAADLHISENAVYIAKCRVLRRLRHELHGLIDQG